MYDIMQAGAKAVKLGTRFVTTFECDASIEFKNSYLACDQKDLVIIKSPVGLPGRVVTGEFVERVQEGKTKPFKCVWHCLSTCNYKEAPYCIAQALFNAADGKMSEGFAFAGANAYRAKRINHVSEVIQELVSEYESASLDLPTLENTTHIHHMEEIRAVS